MPSQIVVVHNDHSFRNNLVKALTDVGHDVTAFSTPMEAWDTIQTLEGSKMEILITKIQFGEGSPHGVALARSFRSRLPTLKILFVTLPKYKCHIDDLGWFMPGPTTTIEEIVGEVDRLIPLDGWVNASSGEVMTVGA